jgi:ribosomal protein L18E
VAETLEAEADMMPPSEISQADIWRDVAKDLRASKSTKMVRVWEETETKSAAASTG